MYLKSIEINGFKSFAKKSDLNFKNQISGIVGPNGSGKSNIAEAFRFVLGEQSMKNMRGKKGEDLIFSGKTGRLNRGSVKVIFDNKDRTLNIDFDEVNIERAVYRDGTNEYLINGSKVRAKDVLELLTSANIGASGHHIISQGEADKILSISPKDRKSVLEEALGLKAFVIKKQGAERKLEKTDENLKEVKTRERVNAPRIRYLEKEVEKIQKSKDLREELIRLYKNFFPHKNDLKKQLGEINEKIVQIEEVKKKNDEHILEKKEELEKTKTQNVSDKNKNDQILALKRDIENFSQNRKD
jgi:chromosome segregation protein